MQFFWLYMDDLIGKGLGIWMILQLLFYMSTTMVPLALPLGILLASIMTFGNMGENFELVAIKSSGISLLRFMRPLLLFILLIGTFAFFFNNNIIPVANLKALSLLYDLRNSKPTLNIRAGQFNNDIEGYSIRVGSKDKDGHTIRDIIIYDQSSGLGNDKVVLAKQGEMIPSPDKQFLIFRLKDGWRYEEGATVNGAQNYDQIRMHFKQWDKVFDLSSFRLTRTNESYFRGAYQMMDVKQLSEGIDSLQKSRSKIVNEVGGYVYPFVTWYAVGKDKDSLVNKLERNKQVAQKYRSSFLELAKDSLKQKMLEQTVNNARNVKSMLDLVANDNKLQTENYLKYKVEWHRKFTLSFACVLLFLIGAPLGAIIRKGGLGMPLVIAVGFFVIFHITSITGEKLARAGSVPSWIGMWMATGMLLPIAFFLINQARNDSPIFNKDWYLRIWTRIKGVIPFVKK